MTINIRCRSVARPRAIVAIAASAFGAVSVAVACPPDFDGDGTVGGSDLGVLLSQWGGPGSCDLNGDAYVDGLDLAVVLGAWGDCPKPPPPPESVDGADLAAVALATYPFATWVDAFSATEGIGLAVDPAQYPAAAGKTALLWIVPNRTAAQWAADASLADARPAGPQSVVLPAVTLQGGVVAVNTAGLVAGDGDAPGRGYDMVLDLDSSGTLTPGDLVDGAGDAPGFWWMRDLTAAGPYATATIASYDVNDPDIIDSMELERIYYPTNAPGARPMVVISHGNGHNYAWYDYLGNHLASWGFVVMSHQNDTVPGIETASTTTLEHTESFIAQHPGISGGVLAGKVDSTRIVWIGHSRGGEGVARGYDRMVDGTFTSPSYVREHVRLVISIAPTDFLGAASANPHGVPYMLLYGSADGDVCGCPDSDIGDSFNVFERATGMRHAAYVHGADHNDFNCCGFNDFTGPSGTAIGPTGAQAVTKAMVLAMIRRTLSADLACGEYLWRQSEAVRPAGQSAAIGITKEWRPAPGTYAVIDDFQSASSLDVSSSGGAVTRAGTSSEAEVQLNDLNTSFSWLTSDPVNGAVRTRAGESSRALVFSWNAAASIEWSIPVALRDLNARKYLSFRAGQGTRHPNTVAALGDLDLTVALRDAAGRERAVRISALGGGIEEPYQRTGFGTGAGWQLEMDTVRVRLADLRSGGGDFDFGAVTAVVLRMGGANGSAVGRLVLDDILLEDE